MTGLFFAERARRILPALSSVLPTAARCVVLLVTALCAACSGRCSRPPQAAGEYDVFLLIGQSNMAGRGLMAEADTARLKGVWLLDERGEAVPAHNPLNRFSSVRKELPMQQISPGTAFGQTVAERTGRRVLLVVNALGGSGIAAWMKDAPLVADPYSIGLDSLQLYGEAVRRTRQAMKYGRLRGILWHQGESDAAHPDAYMRFLKRLATDLRHDLDAADVLFIAGELACWMPAHAEFNAMIRRVEAFLPNARCVSAQGVAPQYGNEDPHFSREGQLLLGRRYAEKVLEAVYGTDSGRQRH